MKTYEWTAIIGHITKTGKKFVNLQTVYGQNILIAETETERYAYLIKSINLKEGEIFLGTILIRTN